MSDMNYMSNSLDYDQTTLEDTTPTLDDVEKISINPSVIDEYYGEIIQYVQSSDDITAHCHYLKYILNSIDMAVAVRLMRAEYMVHQVTVQWIHTITKRQLKLYGFPSPVIRIICYLHRGFRQPHLGHMYNDYKKTLERSRRKLFFLTVLRSQRDNHPGLLESM